MWCRSSAGAGWRCGRRRPHTGLARRDIRPHCRSRCRDTASSISFCISIADGGRGQRCGRGPELGFERCVLRVAPRGVVPDADLAAGEPLELVVRVRRTAVVGPHHLAEAGLGDVAVRRGLDDVHGDADLCQVRLDHLHHVVRARPARVAMLGVASSRREFWRRRLRRGATWPWRRPGCRPGAPAQ